MYGLTYLDVLKKGLSFEELSIKKKLQVKVCGDDGSKK